MKLTKKVKKISIGLIFGTIGCWFFLGLGLTTPGLGLESLNFIKSVEKQIDNLFPKNKFVLSGDNEILQLVMDNSIKTSYEADIISSMNNDPNITPNYDQLHKSYIDFADNWYKDTWQSKIDNHQNIDLYDVGKDFVKFDKAVAEEFHSYGYVNVGIGWMFHSNGIKEIFSSEIYKECLFQQTVIDQSEYDNWIKYTGPGLTGVQIKSSIGTMIVNNKVWFLNLQRESIKFAINTFGGSIFTNKKIVTDDIGKQITVNDLYKPNFTINLHTLRAGVVIFLMWPFLAAGLSGFGAYLILKLKKDK